MDIEYEIASKRKLIDDELQKCLKPQYPNEIYEAMSYSVFAGGKRIRPMLLLGATEAVSGNIEKALPFAIAVELIHTYSLIHDDLPSMDNDDLRRGKPTNHKVFGEALATLAGDGLLNLAYEIMAKACASNLTFENAWAMAEIANAAGVWGMIGGQVVDILSENKNIEKDELIYIHRNKTAALIRASLAAGAIIGGASKAKVLVFKEAGEKLGLTFQIKDDLLDIYGDEKTLGKPINSDKKNNKVTYVSMFGLKNAQKYYLAASNEAVEMFESLSAKFLSMLARSLINREK